MTARALRVEAAASDGSSNAPFVSSSSSHVTPYGKEVRSLPHDRTSHRRLDRLLTLVTTTTLVTTRHMDHPLPSTSEPGALRVSELAYGATMPSIVLLFGGTIELTCEMTT
jgi:hypothetical protein